MQVSSSSNNSNNSNDSSYTYEIEALKDDDELEIEPIAALNTDSNKSTKRSSYYQSGTVKQDIGVRKKFSRVFSNPIIPSLLSLENINKFPNKVTNDQYYGVQGHAHTARSSEGTGRSAVSTVAQNHTSKVKSGPGPRVHGISPLFPPAPKIGLRHTRHTPYDISQEAKEDQIEKESLFPMLPLNYVDPRGAFI